MTEINGESTPGLPTEDAVLLALGGVVDPELHASIVDLGMVREVSVGPGGEVRVTIALTIAGCPMRAQIDRDVQARLRGLPGVESVKITMGEMNAQERSEVMARARWEARKRAPETEVPATTRVIAIASGKGGVGKSSLTVNLAAALASRGFVVGVLDADIWGFSVPRMLGIEGRLGGAAGKIHPHEIPIAGRNGAPDGQIKVVSMGFLVDDEETALMWRGLMLSKAVEQFLVDVAWGELDYLLVDMPPGTGDVQMALGRLLPQTQVLVVTTPALAAQKVAARIADMARRSYLPVIGVVENMSAFECEHGESYAIFGAGGGAALAGELGVALLGQVPIEACVSAGGDVGRPAVLDRPESAAAVVIDEVARRISEELLAPLAMAGCTARIFDLIEKASATAKA